MCGLACDRKPQPQVNSAAAAAAAAGDVSRPYRIHLPNRQRLVE